MIGYGSSDAFFIGFIFVIIQIKEVIVQMKNGLGY